MKLLGLELMTDAKATNKEEHSLEKLEKQALKSPDAHIVQNANGQQLRAALKANLDHHSGSAGRSDAESIQIHMGDGRIASRLSAVTENQPLELGSIKNARSISLNELVEKQEKGKDPIARSLVGEFEQLLSMRNGPAKKALEEKLQDNADRAYGRGQYALRERPVSQTLENTPEGWLAVGRKIAQLPLEQQMQVISRSLTALEQQHERDEQERSIGDLIGIVQGVGHIAENLAAIVDFGAALIARNNEKTNTMGAECGTALGQSIVSGVRLFQAAQKYSYDIGYSGDYGKPFSDIMAVGNALNDHWDQLPPKEQERVKYRFITEMIGDGAIGAGAGQAIGKAKKFTEVLDAVAEHATTHGVKAFEATKKAAKTIAEAVDGLIAPEYAMPGGSKIKWRDIKGPEENVLFMKSDKGLPQGIKPSEKVEVSRSINECGHLINHIKVPEEVLKAAEVQGLGRVVAQKKLQQVANSIKDAHYTMGNYDPHIHGTERAYGNKFHEILRQNLNQLGDSTISTEASYLEGNPSEWGKLGTSRVDISLGNKDEPFASICLKTLKAVPSSKQERGWARNLPKLKDGSVPPRLYVKLTDAEE
jgi:hypothetical protein